MRPVRFAAILVSDVVGYSRLAGADEDSILARLRVLRSDLIDPTVATHRGRVVKRTGDGSLIEFSSVVEAVRCAIEVQKHLGSNVLSLSGANGRRLGSAISVASRGWSTRLASAHFATLGIPFFKVGSSATAALTLNATLGSAKY